MLYWYEHMSAKQR